MRLALSVEDSLRPLCGDESLLWFFGTADGALYLLDSTGYHQYSLVWEGRPFVVPGATVVWDLRHDEEVLRCTPVQLRDRPARGRSRAFGCPGTGTHRLTGVITSASGSPTAIFTRLDEPSGLILLDLATGNVLPQERGALLGELRALLPNGEEIIQEERHVVLGAAGDDVKRVPGQLSGVACGRVLVRQSDHSSASRWFLTGTDDVVELLIERWSIQSAGITADEVLAYATDEAGNQRLWRRRIDSDLWQALGPCPTVSIFSMGGDPVILRSTGLRQGSTWTRAGHAWRGSAEPREDLSVVASRPASLPTLVATRSGSDRADCLVVSLHGGPDSHELDDLRYGGIYRELLDRRTDVAIVNYPGSTGLGEAFQRSAWKAWAAAGEDVRAAVRTLQEAGQYCETVILGVSFGAWIALQAAKELPHTRVVLASPVIDMSSHLDSHHQLTDWAAVRFDRPELMHCDARALSYSGPVTAILPRADEVVDPQATRSALDTIKGRTIIEVDGPHYPRRADHAAARWAAVSSAIRAQSPSIARAEADQTPDSGSGSR